MDIKVTKDYSLFSNIKGNRPLYNSHVARLTIAIADKNYLLQNPILVNEKMEIIDGQHRLEVARNNNLSIAYMVIEGGNLKDVQELNILRKGWNTKDYLDCFVEIGDKSYIRFAEFISQYHLSISEALTILNKKSNGVSYRNFKEGTMTVTIEEVAEARYRAEVLVKIREYFIDTGFKSAHYAKAIMVLCESGNGDLLLDKLQASKKTLKRQVSLEDFLRMFEVICNWKNTGVPVRLY